MLSALWGRITGKDKRKKYPDQQGVFLGRVGDYAIVSPYGLYGDLPADTLLLEIKPGVAIPVTVKRPSDTAQGEPTFFHPSTNTRIIARNNGDLDVICDYGTAGNVNVTCVNANVTASEDVTVTANNITATATANATVNAADMTANVSGGTIINCPTNEVTGNVEIGGNLSVTGNIETAAALTVAGSSTLAGVTSNGKNVGDTHVHPAGTPPGNTGAPI